MPNRSDTQPEPQCTGAHITPVFLSVPQAAKVLGCSPGLIYQLIREGDFPAFKVGAKKYVIPLRAIDHIVDIILATGGLVDVSNWKLAWDLLTSQHSR